MKKKINLLILVSILGLIALSIIQGYLINNTYELKKKAFIAEAKRSITQIDDFSPALDSLSGFWQEHFIIKLIDYKYGLIKKVDVVDGLQYVIDSINVIYVKEYLKELNKNKIPYDIKFHKSVKAIILLDSIKNDTLFNYKMTPKRIILGSPIATEDKIPVNSTSWQTEHSSSRILNSESRDIEFNLLLITEDYIDIEDWKAIVFKQMSGLLLLSLLIFSVVIGLLYYSIKSLITQKKIADIKTDFINNITHELKTPLATLTLATKMLKTNEVKLQPKLVENTVNTIERQNKRLQKLIDQVLNNSLGYNEIQLNKESVSIETYINTILDDFQLAVKSEAIVINRKFSIVIPTINIDKFYTTTALLNILENAIKYAGDALTIDCNIETSSALKISIKDNGIGISDKDKIHIFDKFFRAGNKEIHNVKGLGLGLYYTHQIIKAHNGTITVESKEGKGTTFILTLPFN